MCMEKGKDGLLFWEHPREKFLENVSTATVKALDQEENDVNVSGEVNVGAQVEVIV